MDRDEVFMDFIKKAVSSGDYTSARKLLIQVNTGAESCELLGELYYEGKGGEADREKAAQYFRQAAEYGSVDGMCNAALCTPDMKEKMHYYRHAAEAGCAYAMNMVGIMTEELTGDREDPQQQDASDPMSPAYWFLKAALAGEPAGAYNYSFYAKEPAEREQYLRQARDAGYEAIQPPEKESL